MLEICAKIYALLDRRNRTLLPIAVLLSGTLAVLETLGIAMILPILSVMGSDGATGNIGEGFLPGRIGETFISYFTDQLSLTTLCLLAFGLLVTKNLLGIWIVRWTARYGLSIKASVAQALLDRYLYAPFLWHSAQKSSEIIRNIQAATQVVSAIVIPLINVLPDIFLIVLLMAVLLNANLLGTTFAALFLLVAVWLNHRLTRGMARRAGVQSLTSYASVIQNVQESLGAIREIKLFGREEQIGGLFRYNFGRMMDAQFVDTILSQIPRFLLEIVTLVAIAVFVAVSVYNVGAEAILPTLGLFAAAAVRLAPATNRVVIAVQKMRTALPALEAVHHDMVELSPPAGGGRVGRQDMREWNSLEFRNVGFTFPGRSGFALSDISFTLARGQLIGVVGKTGSGKSTLIDILTGLIEPSVGELLLDGRPFLESKDRWQSALGFVPQQVFLLDDTIRRNIAFALPDDLIDEERISEVIHLVGLEEFVAELPEGIETFVGERGATLSGGQIQRLGLARALYGDPEVLVLDEATSALDNETERRIHEYILSAKGDRTIVIIAHRLSTVVDCDAILFMEKGKLSCMDTFARLVDKSDGFRAMVSAGRIDHGS